MVAARRVSHASSGSHSRRNAHTRRHTHFGEAERVPRKCRWVLRGTAVSPPRRPRDRSVAWRSVPPTGSSLSPGSVSLAPSRMKNNLSALGEPRDSVSPTPVFAALPPFLSIFFFVKFFTSQLSIMAPTWESGVHGPQSVSVATWAERRTSLEHSNPLSSSQNPDVGVFQFFFFFFKICVVLFSILTAH